MSIWFSMARAALTRAASKGKNLQSSTTTSDAKISTIASPIVMRSFAVKGLNCTKKSVLSIYYALIVCSAAKI